jgi:hypothetical protein
VENEMEEKNTETKGIVKEVSLDEEMIVIISDPAIYSHVFTIKLTCTNPECVVEHVNTFTGKTEKRKKSWGTNLRKGKLFKENAICSQCGQIAFEEYR